MIAAVWLVLLASSIPVEKELSGYTVFRNFQGTLAYDLEITSVDYECDGVDCLDNPDACPGFAVAACDGPLDGDPLAIRVATSDEFIRDYGWNCEGRITGEMSNIRIFVDPQSGEPMVGGVPVIKFPEGTLLTMAGALASVHVNGQECTGSGWASFRFGPIEFQAENLPDCTGQLGTLGTKLISDGYSYPFELHVRHTESHTMHVTSGLGCEVVISTPDPVPLEGISWTAIKTRF